MITVSNAIMSSLAFLPTQRAGHMISMPAKVAACLNVPLDEFCSIHGLTWWIDGKTLSLRLIADGENFVPPDSTIPKPGTPVNQLHPGNRFRLMMGQPLLPEPKA